MTADDTLRRDDRGIGDFKEINNESNQLAHAGNRCRRCDLDGLRAGVFHEEENVTTVTTSPWSIVDQIIRQEIPDAVPGCGYLRAIESFEATDRMMWLTLPHVVSTILDQAGESYYRRTLIKHLATRVLGMVCDVKYDESVNSDVMGYLAKNVELIRKTLAEIRGNV